jgi:DNA-directed RNA polymerase subunit RPC12/RpoP
VGLILMAAGLLTAVAIGGWLMTGVAAGRLASYGAALGAILGLILVVPLIGVGGYLMFKGVAESREYAEMEKEKRLLNMVETQGQIKISAAALEMRVTRDQVQAYLYDLVGKGLFSGYVNWQEGVLYARQASEIKNSGKCPNCGGALELAGKGVIRCPYCGSEIFLS